MATLLGPTREFPTRPFVLDVADLKCELLMVAVALRHAGHEPFPLLRQAQSASMEIHSLEHHASKRQKLAHFVPLGRLIIEPKKQWK